MNHLQAMAHMQHEKLAHKLAEQARQDAVVMAHSKIMASHEKNNGHMYWATFHMCQHGAMRARILANATSLLALLGA